MTTLQIVARINQLLRQRFGKEAGYCCRSNIRKRTFHVRAYKDSGLEHLTECQAMELIEALEMLWQPRADQHI